MSSTSIGSSNNNPMNGYDAWQNALNKLEAEVKDIENQIKSDVALINQLESEKAKLGNSPKLRELERLKAEALEWEEMFGEVPKGLQDQIKSLEKQVTPIIAKIGELNQQIKKAQSKLSKDEQTLANDKENLTNFEGTSSANAAQNQAVNKTISQTQKQVRSQEQKQQNATAERKAAIEAIQDEIEIELATSQDAILQIGDIKNDKERIAQDNADISEIKHKIKEDAIKLGALGIFAWAAAAYWGHQIHDLENELNDKRNDLHTAQNELAVHESKLKTDMNKLETLSVKGLDNLINGLFKEISKLVDLFGKGGKASESTMQEASAIIAQVMAIVEMITAKVHQMRSQDQQWMSRASAANSEVKAVQSKINVQSFEALEKYAHFMKMTMKTVQVVADVAAVAIAVATGGTCAIVMAIIMVALSASGLMEKATEALAQSMHKLGASAKAVADIIMGVASMVATMGTSAIAEGIGQAVEEVSEEVSQEVGEMIEMDVMDVLKDGIGKIASSIQEAGSEIINDVEEAGEEVEEVVKTVVEKFQEAITKFFEKIGEALTNAKNFAASAGSKAGAAAKENFTNVKGMAGQTTAYWGSANGLVDATQAAYADGTGQAGVAYNKVKMAEWMQILQIVMTVVQAVMQMAAVYYGGGANSDETPVMERIFGKMSKMSFVTNAAVVTELAAQDVGVVAQGNLMVNSLAKSDLTKKMGENQAELAYIKSTGEQRKLFEKKQIELFASQMEQQIAALYTQVKKNGEAEREAAMVLQQSAV